MNLLLHSALKLYELQSKLIFPNAAKASNFAPHFQNSWTKNIIGHVQFLKKPCNFLQEFSRNGNGKRIKMFKVFRSKFSPFFRHFFYKGSSKSCLWWCGKIEKLFFSFFFFPLKVGQCLLISIFYRIIEERSIIEWVISLISFFKICSSLWWKFLMF